MECIQHPIILLDGKHELYLGLYVGETLGQVMTRTPEDARLVREMREDYVKNRRDRDAQLDMVTDMLLRLGGRRGVL